MTDTVTRSVRYDFTASEIHDLSMDLANKTKELSAISEEKKSATSQFTARINEAKAATNKLSNLVTDGFEYRDVECEVQYHKPEQGKKTFIRLDTSKVVAVEQMTEFDYTLFNQPVEEDEA